MQPPTDSPAPRGEHVDVEQIMRDIRARIAQRHGIELTAPQILELAARRLEAILDPRNVNPTLLDQLRKAAGSRAEHPAVQPAEPAFTFEDTTIYDSHRGLLRGVRRLLNPILRLFFNPNTVVHALNAQARLNSEQARREAERDVLQSEWNALHYELIRRVVSESARLSLDVQALTLRVESLVARVDFADRRVSALEALPAQRHMPPRQHQEAAHGQSATPNQSESRIAPTPDSPEVLAGDGQRKRRRRRRGRRSGTFGEGPQEPAFGNPGSTVAPEDSFDGTEATDSSDNGDEEPGTPPAEISEERSASPSSTGEGAVDGAGAGNGNSRLEPTS